MTIFLLALTLLVLADLVALTRGLRGDRTSKPPRSPADWGTPQLPTTPYATR